ncbi:MAG: ABC transporter permease [Oscillospiraceae bacterium]
MNKKGSGIGNKYMKMIIRQNELGAIIPLAIMMVVVLFINPSFFGTANLIDILRTSSFIFLIAIPMTFLLTAGGMDLSNGSVLSLGGVVCAMLIQRGWPILMAALAAILCGIAVGLLNGIIIVKFKQPAFITTLGTQYIVNGVALVLTNGQAVTNLPDKFKYLGQYMVFGFIPIPIIYAVVAGVIGYIILNKSKFGRAISAIGGNPETAYLAGINVVTKRTIIFVSVSIMAALTGIIYASRFSSGIPGAGTGIEMKIMAAVIIGGTSMSGGSGTIVGTAIGCVLISTITNFLILIGVASTSQMLIFGVILLFAIFIDKYRRQAIGGGQ